MDSNVRDAVLYVPFTGKLLLESPLLNKGSSFTRQERNDFNLNGLLPSAIEDIHEQAERAYQQYQDAESDSARHIYLRNIQDTNETLFYYLLKTHLSEMLPIVYTPEVGAACEKFSGIYRRARGVFISWPDRERIDDILHDISRNDVNVIVVTDGERILGLGDQGAGGMGIPIGKLSLYTVCGGVNPAQTLPIMLDVGTNNSKLLGDPRYIGWRHPRITGEEYFAFVDMFIAAVKRRWPNVLLQFEDFAQHTAVPLLYRYRDVLCCFNDDIQGTASVALATILAACRGSHRDFTQQVVVIVGAGAAGCGIARHIIACRVAAGMSVDEASKSIFMVDRDGLILTTSTSLADFQRPLAQSTQKLTDWKYIGATPSLLEVIRNAKPTILLGVSGQAGLFTEEVVRTMYHYCDRPVIMPLSNPTSRMEASPEDIVYWTEGQAIIATGSPCEPVEYEGHSVPVSQCNNVYIFPAIGLGSIACGATRITEAMLMAASRALAETSPLVCEGTGGLLPEISTICDVTRQMAFAVAKAAQQSGVANVMNDETLYQRIAEHFWLPQYRPYKRRAI
ncbi:NAD-dependent malic enzyme [Citrobacter amalonaticus]|uniref:NAD-dependent malic enzyme n=1 Tax=Citrobacter amalonaticus TaxID=35703 RepID=UPI00190825F6|nr:NAD-dependent malic enzyme [Citrobacter amalonaticus]ELK6623729.1 NAD-dependent malic enzyme [Citrobacter amalonaticus]MBJ9276109.1 NAD-dependent malic enzyme [Citrobacter amalonaticus]HAT6801272.1 oxaloacetate-decarboxylating malate dehydrogenase [Citrobacter freundii]HAU5066812.1 NAD-dependent malic enzyme [Citrobacter amalonaticus]